jgi:hypothetical protein
MIIINDLNYSQEEIDAALRFAQRNRRVSFRYDLLNKSDAKIGELDGIESATVSYGEFRAIKRTAQFTLNEYLQRNVDYLSDQIQPWFILHMPQGGAVEFPLGIFLLESPKRQASGVVTRREIGAYDKSIIIDSDRFTERYFIPSGTNYAGAVNKILAVTNISKIDITPTASVTKRDIEFEIGTKKKDAVNQLLGEITYTSINVDEVGFFYSRPYIEPAQREITQYYIADKDSIILPEYSEELDIAGQFNVWTRVARNLDGEAALTATIENVNPMSSTSIINRGRRIPSVEEIDDIADQESMVRYVRRIALNAMSTYSKLSLQTVLNPKHGSADTLYTDIPILFEVPQLFSETSWELPLDYAGTMSHEARRVVFL